jgi:adenosine kinase
LAILICGSLAYDKLMTFEGYFREHILPEQTHILNISFLVPSMREELGGCAGNIAYSLRALGDRPTIMATLGEMDAQRYLDHLHRLNLAVDHVRVLPERYSAQAMITTDLENNQITAFHAGAMLFSHLNVVSAAQNITLGIVAPDGALGMQQHAEQFAAADIRFMLDPGQGLPLFNGAQWRKMVEMATYLTLNDYEAKLLSNKTGWSLAQLAARVEALIITRGEQGASIYHRHGEETIPAVPAAQVLSPTGCGDAFRGGLLYGIANGFDWASAGRLASLMGSITIAHRGPQAYPHTLEMIAACFQQAFSYRLL